MINIPSNHGIYNSMFGCVSLGGGYYQNPAPIQVCHHNSLLSLSLISPQFISQLNQIN